MKQVILALALAEHAAALLPTPPVRRTVARYGFLDDLMDKLDGGADKDEAWKDEMMREQQAIPRVAPGERRLHHRGARRRNPAAPREGRRGRR